MEKSKRKEFIKAVIGLSISALIILVVVFLFFGLVVFTSCQKSTVHPVSNGATPPLTPSPTTHKVKYVIYADPRAYHLNGVYSDSASNLIVVNETNWTKYSLDTFSSAAGDTVYYDASRNSTCLGNYQIKIGEVSIGKSAYIKLTGGNKSGLFYSVAIAKDTVISGKTEYIVKAQSILHNPTYGTIELSYKVE